MSNINAFIAKQIIDYRESNGISQRELADKMGVPHTSIARLENGEGGINSNTIEKFCKVSNKKIEFVQNTRKKVEDIADYIIYKFNKDYSEEYDLTKLKLQKLLYYCQVEFLSNNYRELFEHNIVKWKHGPVQKDIFYKYSTLESNLIPQFSVPVSPILDQNEKETVDKIIKLLGKYSAWGLRDMTHEETDENNPWSKCAEGEIILAKDIVNYYKEGKYNFQKIK